MKIIVVHSRYGCDTGCCGHYLEVDGKQLAGSFVFDHPYFGTAREGFRKFAESVISGYYGNDDHIQDLDWDNCIIVND